jgi:hypothetical protein
MAQETIQDNPRELGSLTRARVERLAETPSECELDVIQRAICRVAWLWRNTWPPTAAMPARRAYLRT